MNFLTFDKIYEVQKHAPLNILFLNINNVEYLPRMYMKLKEYGELYIVGGSSFQIGSLRAKLHHLGIKLILPQDIPSSVKFDVVISESNLLLNSQKLMDHFKFEYIYTLDDEWKNDLFKNYSVFSDHCLKRKFVDVNKKNEETKPVKKEASSVNVFVDADKKTTDFKEELKEEDYQSLIEEFTSEPIMYDKYRINYLKPQVPGMVSIIMIISNINTTFPDVLRELRSQNIGLIEFIIIDNAAGFRNNVKPSIRYGEQMPLDFCQYHAKELCSGEYMIFLTEESKPFSISEALEKGEYETR